MVEVLERYFERVDDPRSIRNQRQDKCCIRNDNAAANMGILRKWALNMLHKAKTKPEQSIKSLMRKN